MTNQVCDPVTADGDRVSSGYGDWPAEDAVRGGRDSGPIQDLGTFHRRLAGTGGALCGPGGQAVVPRHLLPTLRRLHTGAGRIPRSTETETVHILPVLDDIAVIRPRVVPQEAGTTGAGAIELCRLRHAWSRELFTSVTSHLAGRSSVDGRLLDQQLVKGALADAVTGQWETEAFLAEGQAGPGDLYAFHSMITKTDRILLRLLGAHGFTLASPGRAAHLSELLADTYVTRADHDGA